MPRRVQARPQAGLPLAVGLPTSGPDGARVRRLPAAAGNERAGLVRGRLRGDHSVALSRAAGSESRRRRHADRARGIRIGTPVNLIVRPRPLPHSCSAGVLLKPINAAGRLGSHVAIRHVSPHQIALPLRGRPKPPAAGHPDHAHVSRPKLQRRKTLDPNPVQPHSRNTFLRPPRRWSCWSAAQRGSGRCFPPLEFRPGDVS